MAVSGVVLAGGASHRFGRDKRAELIDGTPLLRRAVDAVAAVADDVVVVTRADRPLPAEVVLPSAVRVVHDAEDTAGPPTWIAEREPADPVSGPLAGLIAGLEAARHEVVVVLGGDHPWASPAALRDLADHLAEDAPWDAAVADDGRPQPLVGAYRRRVAAVARTRAAAGDRRLVGLLDHLTVARVTDLAGRDAAVADVDVPADLPAPDGAEGTADIDGTAGRDRSGDARPPARSIAHVTVRRVGPGEAHDRGDVVVVEEPLAIAVAGPDGIAHPVTTTLRTPGHEDELAVGFLHADGVLTCGEVVGTSAGDVYAHARPDDQITVHLSRPVDPDSLVHRHAGATASCGLCGRATIDDLLARTPPVTSDATVSWEVLAALPDRLRAAQATFAATGGLHAGAIATTAGELLTVREDVGRHNALDAVIGRHLLDGQLPLHTRVVVLSGRIGTELVQKAAVAGAPIVVAVGAPSDLAVRTADAAGVTLVGFVRDGTGNVYTHATRVLIDDAPREHDPPSHEPPHDHHLPDRRRSTT